MAVTDRGYGSGVFRYRPVSLWFHHPCLRAQIGHAATELRVRRETLNAKLAEALEWTDPTVATNLFPIQQPVDLEVFTALRTFPYTGKKYTYHTQRFGIAFLPKRILTLEDECDQAWLQAKFAAFTPGQHTDADTHQSAHGYVPRVPSYSDVWDRTQRLINHVRGRTQKQILHESLTLYLGTTRTAVVYGHATDR